MDPSGGEEHEVVEGGAALGDPPQTEPHALYDDCIREVLNLLNVRQQCVASCVSKRWLSAFQSMPLANLELSLLHVRHGYFAGFEAWLVRRLQGPQGGTLRRLQLVYCTHDQPSFTQHQRRVFAALGQCPQLTELQVLSESQYSEFDWAAVASLPTQLQRLCIAHVNLAFDAQQTAGDGSEQRWVTLGHLARFPRLRHLRISCMPLPAVPFSAESLWHLVALPSPPALRELQYLELAAAFADVGAASHILIVATALTELRLKAHFMSTGGMAAISQLPRLQALRLQLGPPSAQAPLHLLAACGSLRALSVTFDMRVPRFDPGVAHLVAVGMAVAFDLCAVPQLEALRFMVFPDDPRQPSGQFQLEFSSPPQAVSHSKLQILDLRVAQASAVVPFQVLMGLQELHTFRLQAGSMVLRPPLVAGGLPSWRGASGVVQPWLQRLQGLHLRCMSADTRTAAAMQAFEMMDGSCMHEQSMLGDENDGGPLLHLWKGDAHAECVAQWGLSA